MTILDYILIASIVVSNYYIYYFYTLNKETADNSCATIENLTEQLGSAKLLLQQVQTSLEESTRDNTTYKTNLFHINEKYENEKNHSKTLNKQVDELDKKIKLIEKDHAKELKLAQKSAREDALKRSRAIIRGQATEHLAPFVMKDTNPKDCRFMGNPVDYILFHGLSDVADGVGDKVKSIKFIDIKTGSSNLNKVQRRIRDCIKEGNVTFEVINPDKDNV